MKSALKTIFSKATNLSIEADLELSRAWEHIRLQGFYDDCDQPVLSICNDNSIIMAWNSMELSEEEIINLMNSKGFIEPSDFRL